MIKVTNRSRWSKPQASGLSHVRMSLRDDIIEGPGILKLTQWWVVCGIPALYLLVEVGVNYDADLAMITRPSKFKFDQTQFMTVIS